MPRFIRIVIFTLLMAAIVFFGFRALLSTNTLQAPKNNQKNSESDQSQTELYQAEKTDTPSVENNTEAAEASESKTQTKNQTNEINENPSGNKDSSADKDSNNSDKKSASEDDLNKEKPE